MKEHFIRLFEYNHWANQRFLKVLEDNKFKNPRIKKLYSHLISSQIVWLHRIKDLPTSPFPLWEDYKLSELKTMSEESTERWITFIKEYHKVTFEEIIRYKNSEGKTYETKLSDIMTHVINHNTYHRSQIALLLRQDDLDPPITDFIAYVRI